MIYDSDSDWNDSCDRLDMVPKLTLKGADLDERVERFLEWKSSLRIAFALSRHDERALFGQLDEPYRSEPFTYERARSLYDNAPAPSLGTLWASRFEPKGTDIDVADATAETTLTAEQRKEWKRWSKQEYFAQVALSLTVDINTYINEALQAQTPVTPKRLQDHFTTFIQTVYRLGELGHPLSDGIVCNLFLFSVPGDVGDRLNVAFVTLPEEKKTKDHLDVLVDNQVCILRMSRQREREPQKERRR